MTRFHVTWSEYVEADSFEEAARIGRATVAALTEEEVDLHVLNRETAETRVIHPPGTIIG